MTNGLIVLTISLPWLGGMGVLLIGDKRPRTQSALAVFFAAAAALAALGLLPLATSSVTLRVAMGTVLGDLTFAPDGLGVFLAAIATVIGSLAVIFSVDYMRGEAQLGRYYALVLVFIGAMAGLVLSASLSFLFIFWEITALCSYALIAFHNDDPKAVAGGIKALLITQLGGVGLLAGALIVRSHLGSYDIAGFLANPHRVPPEALALTAFGFLAAAAAKSAQVPFHTWLPDAMEAPTPVSALIHAATMVNAGVYLLARFYPAFESVSGWKLSLVVIGLTSALLAACMAIAAVDLKRALAYSTISQLGYMVCATGIGAIFASQFHLLSHAMFKALLFLSAGAVIQAVGTRDLTQLGGLGMSMPFVRGMFVAGALAVAGVPIFSGFWSKELVLEAGLAAGPAWAHVGMLIGAGLTALYAFRLVWLIFYGERRCLTPVRDAPPAMRAALLPLALGATTIWILAGPFSHLLDNTLRFHHVRVLSTPEMMAAVATAASTTIVLMMVAAGLATWWWRDRLTWLTRRLTGLTRMAAEGFGFDWINRAVVNLTKRAAAVSAATQTGQLNWNVTGIVAGLIIVLAIVVWG